MRYSAGLVVALPLALAASAALAQQPGGGSSTQQQSPSGAPVKPVDPRQAAAQAAFEALPDADRRAIQNDLVWATDYFGAALGTFGKLTYDGITGFQKQSGGRQDGILDPDQRQKLADLAQKRRAAAGFKLVTDPNTGSRIAILTSIPLTQEKTPQGTKWSYGSDFVLETVKTAPDHVDLAGTFGRFVNANVPGRKVTYKLSRPDFFVVSGDQNNLKFYTRFAPTSEGLRGYTVTYNPKFNANADRFVIALANIFEPLAAGKDVAAATNATPSTAAAPKPAPPMSREASALLVGHGLALVPSGAILACKALSVGGKPAQLASSDADTGLSLLKTAADVAEAPKLANPADEGEVGIFGFSGGKLLAAPSEFAAKATSLDAALQPGMFGGVILSKSGEIRGLVADDPGAKPQIGGIAISGDYHVIGADKLAATLTKASLPQASSTNEASRTIGELAQMAAKFVAPLNCGL